MWCHSVLVRLFTRSRDFRTCFVTECKYRCRADRSIDLVDLAKHLGLDRGCDVNEFLVISTSSFTDCCQRSLIHAIFVRCTHPTILLIPVMSLNTSTQKDSCVLCLGEGLGCGSLHVPSPITTFSTHERLYSFSLHYKIISRIVVLNESDLHFVSMRMRCKLRDLLDKYGQRSVKFFDNETTNIEELIRSLWFEYPDCFVSKVRAVYIPRKTRLGVAVGVGLPSFQVPAQRCTTSLQHTT